MSDRRTRFRTSLSPLYLPFYDALCAELPAEWKPIQGVRTFSEQNALYEQGRTTVGPNPTEANPLGSTVTDARGGESPHNYGCATDWILFKGTNPLWLPKRDPRWKPYFDACDKLGLKKGADFGDRPHNELAITVSWRAVHKVLLEKGSAEAQAFIESVRKK